MYINDFKSTLIINQPTKMEINCKNSEISVATQDSDFVPVYEKNKSSRGLAVMHLTQTNMALVQGPQAIGDVRKGIWS